MEIKFKKLNPKAYAPVYTTDGAAGMDFAFSDAMEEDGYLQAIRKDGTNAYSEYPRWERYFQCNEHGYMHSMWVIPAHATVKIHTGIAVELPKGTCGLLVARSGIANHYHVAPADKCGVIDCDYRGEIIIHLTNENNKDFVIQDGMRIAQMIVVQAPQYQLIETATLSETARGKKGFGSSGWILEDQNRRPEHDTSTGGQAYCNTFTYTNTAVDCNAKAKDCETGG